MKIPTKRQIESTLKKNVTITKGSPMLNLIKEAGIDYLRVRIAEGLLTEDLSDDSILTLLGIYLFNKQNG